MNQQLFHVLVLGCLLLASLGGGPEKPVAPQPSAETLLQFTSGGHILGFGADAVYAANSSLAYRVTFVGANPTSPAAEDTVSGAGGAPPMGSVTYPDLWEGITLTYDTPEGTLLRSTYQLEPHADPNLIRLRYNTPVKIEDDGTLTLYYAMGALSESAPIAWQEPDGARQLVAVRFAQFGANDVGFQVGEYNPTLPLMIDPSLNWHTFLGGNSNDGANAIAVDGSGAIYVAGISEANWGSPVRAFGGNKDCFVAKLNSSGGLIWHTFLGGAGSDEGYAITVDGSGSVYVGGFSDATWSPDVPVSPFNGSGFKDSFAAKLNPTDGGLSWHTFLGGSRDDVTNAIAVDGSGAVFVTGDSESTWGTPLQVFGGNKDCFVAKLNTTSGALSWNTFLGGGGWDYGYAIAVDGSGAIYVAGISDATWGAPVRPYTNADDAFTAKLDSSGGLTWHTFLGGDGEDRGHAIAVDESGSVYVAGSSPNSWGSPKRIFSGTRDAFVVKLNATDGDLNWNTFLGGEGYDEGWSIDVDNSGAVFISGYSDATWGSPPWAYTDNDDAFAAKLSSGGDLSWNTFLGGTGEDRGFSIAVDGNGAIYVAGRSYNSWGSPEQPHSGSLDAFVAKINEVASISGTVNFIGSLPLMGPILVNAHPDLASDPIASADGISSGQSYLIEDLPTGTYYISAFMDTGDDGGPPLPGEPFDWYDADGDGVPDPVEVSANEEIIGINLTLYTRHQCYLPVLFH